MKYTLHFIRYTLLFFVIFDLVFAFVLFISAGFDIFGIIHRSILINLITMIFIFLISSGGGYYIASFLIFHHRFRRVSFIGSVLFAMLALKAESPHIIFRRMESLLSVSPVVTMIIIFGLSLVLMAISVSEQFKHDLILVHSGGVSSAAGETSLFM